MFSIIVSTSKFVCDNMNGTLFSLPSEYDNETTHNSPHGVEAINKVKIVICHHLEDTWANSWAKDMGPQQGVLLQSYGGQHGNYFISC